jgi:hypothetical protein
MVAGRQTRPRKLASIKGDPQAAVQIRSPDASPSLSMCVTSSPITNRGTGTVRRPARDFGAPNVGVPSRPRVRVSATWMLDDVTSTRSTRSAASSPWPPGVGADEDKGPVRRRDRSGEALDLVGVEEPGLLVRDFR